MPMLKPRPSGTEFTARFTGIDGKPHPRRQRRRRRRQGAVPRQRAARPGRHRRSRRAARKGARGRVAHRRDEGAPAQNPTAPFTTSKLQQDAAGRLGFNVRRTMGVAQRLYEGVEIGSEGTVGLITYMRTDSTRVSRRSPSPPLATTSARSSARKYLPANAQRLQGQEGRAGRPRSHPPDQRRVTPRTHSRSTCRDEQYRLYKLIWQRFVA